jgi:hypothetical protein
MALNVQKKVSSQRLETSSRRRKQYRSRAELVRSPAGKSVLRCRRKFLRYYPKGFADSDYLDLERGYKWLAHERWVSALGEKEFGELLQAGEFREVASRAVAIEARTNLLFSFEKMALRDAVKSAAGARRFSEALFEFLHGPGSPGDRFTAWCAAVSELPRRQTRVLTWPIVTVFGFIAKPRVHFFLKPFVTRKAAEQYGFVLEYNSRPGWATYSRVLTFAKAVRTDVRDLRPRDMIDIQSFLWVQGSDEYPD